MWFLGCTINLVGLDVRLFRIPLTASQKEEGVRIVLIRGFNDQTVLPSETEV